MFVVFLFFSGIASSLHSLQAQPTGGILSKSFASAVSVSELPSPARSKILCGETGIRTPETLLKFTRFPGVPLKPLEHLSLALLGANLNIGYKGTAFFANTQEFE